MQLPSETYAHPFIIGMIQALAYPFDERRPCRAMRSLQACRQRGRGSTRNPANWMPSRYHWRHALVWEPAAERALRAEVIDERFFHAHEPFSALRVRPVPRRKQDGDGVLADASSHALGDAVAAGGRRIETLELGHRYGHLSPLLINVV